VCPNERSLVTILVSYAIKLNSQFFEIRADEIKNAFRLDSLTVKHLFKSIDIEALPANQSHLLRELAINHVTANLFRTELS
jgi:hypothetical protein